MTSERRARRLWVELARLYPAPGVVEIGGETPHCPSHSFKLELSRNLGWKLAGVLGGAPERLLDSYKLERLPVAAAMLGLSKRLHLSRSSMLFKCASAIVRASASDSILVLISINCW